MTTRLLEASLIETGTLTSTSFLWQGKIPSTGAVLWSIVATDGARSIQLGCKFVDGELAAQFVNDWAAAQQGNLDQPQLSYDFDEGELMAMYPGYQLSHHLETGFTATGSLTIETTETTVPAVIG